MSPLYETAEDRERETQVAEAITQATGWTMHRLPDTRSAADWIATNTLGEVAAIIEIKCRTNRHDKYPTYMIDMNKWNNIHTISSQLHTLGLLVVAFTNGIAYISTHSRTGFTISKGGRRDRNDPHDIREVLLIPIERMHNIKRLATL